MAFFDHRRSPPDPTHFPSAFKLTCKASLDLSLRLFPADTEMQATKLKLQTGKSLTPATREALRRSLVSSMALVECGKVNEAHLNLSELEDALANLRLMTTAQVVQA